MFHHERIGAVYVLRGSVALDRQNVTLAQAACEPMFDRGQTKIVFDLEQIPLIDSAGLEWMLDLRDRCMQRGGSIVVASPNALCSDILRASGVSDRVGVYENVSTAIGSFTR